MPASFYINDVRSAGASFPMSFVTRRAARTPGREVDVIDAKHRIRRDELRGPLLGIYRLRR